MQKRTQVQRALFVSKKYGPSKKKTKPIPKPLHGVILMRPHKSKPISKKKVTIKLVYDSQWEEYQVRYIEDGVVNEDKTYYTEDYNDALDTMVAMKKELEVDQHGRLDQTGDTLNISLPKIKGQGK